MNDEFEARIAELQQRSKAVKQHEVAELDRQKTALAEHANGIRRMIEGEFIDRWIAQTLTAVDAELLALGSNPEGRQIRNGK